MHLLFTVRWEPVQNHPVVLTRGSFSFCAVRTGEEPPGRSDAECSQLINYFVHAVRWRPPEVLTRHALRVVLWKNHRKFWRPGMCCVISCALEEPPEVLTEHALTHRVDRVTTCPRKRTAAAYMCKFGQARTRTYTSYFWFRPSPFIRLYFQHSASTITEVTCDINSEWYFSLIIWRSWIVFCPSRTSAVGWASTSPYYLVIKDTILFK